MRNILADKPRVTKFPIDWEGNGQKQEDAQQQGGNEESAMLAKDAQQVDDMEM